MIYASAHAASLAIPFLKPSKRSQKKLSGSLTCTLLGGLVREIAPEARKPLGTRVTGDPSPSTLCALETLTAIT